MSETVKFEPVTRESLRAVQRWFATLTRPEVLAYADQKLMDRRLMLSSHKAARKAQRP